jgi:hypothetical protein
MTAATPSLHVRASQVLRNKKIWIAPILLAAVFTAVMAPSISARSSIRPGTRTACR